MSSFSIIFEDEEVVAVSKPAGLLVHRGEATSRREIALLQLVRAELNQRVYPIHRLDRATSGLVLFAKSARSAAWMGEQMRGQQLSKIYLAVVRSWPTSPQTIDYPLKSLDERETLQEAVTELRCLGRATLETCVETLPQARYGFLELKPLSGRRHQLRRHLSHIHHPLIGDTTYGRGAHNRFFRTNFDCQRLLLHHASTRWMSRSGAMQSAAAPLDAAWMRVLEALNWTNVYEDWLRSSSP